MSTGRQEALQKHWSAGCDLHPQDPASALADNLHKTALKIKLQNQHRRLAGSTVFTQFSNCYTQRITNTRISYLVWELKLFTSASNHIISQSTNKQWHTARPSINRILKLEFHLMCDTLSSKPLLIPWNMKKMSTSRSSWELHEKDGQNFIKTK